jgi:hypothetical protein
MPNRPSDCNFSPIQDGNDVVLLAINGTDIIDDIKCASYSDCLQKICLLANEPNIIFFHFYKNENKS